MKNALFLTMVLIATVSCQPTSSSVRGALTNQANDNPLSGARVVLCRTSGEKSCVIDSSLTAVTDNEGKFGIADVKQGKYIVLYNGSGEKPSSWEGMKINFTPLAQKEMGRGPLASFPIVSNIAKTLGEPFVSACALTSETNLATNTTMESGYVYLSQSKIAFILVKNELVAFEVNGETTVNLSVWNTQKDACAQENFNPIR